MANDPSTKKTPTSARRNETRTEERETHSGPRLTMFNQFDSRLLTLESEYGVRLSCSIRRNVETSNGNEGQWLAEVWFYDGGTKISTSVIAVPYADMHNQALENLRIMLQDHARPIVQERSVRPA